MKIFSMEKLTPSQTGWLMMFSVFVDSWFVFSVPMALGPIKGSFHPSALLLGLIAGSVNMGALAGSLAGGIISDRIGRKASFTISIIMFAAAAVGEALSSSPLQLAGFRALAGFPIGADIVTGYAFIMDVMAPGERDRMGARNTLMASAAIVLINVAVLAGILAGIPGGTSWRLVMVLPLIPLGMLAIMRMRLPDPVVVGNAGSGNGKRRSGILEFIRSDLMVSRTCLFCWISIAAGATEVGTFSYFIPATVGFLHISSPAMAKVVVILVFTVGIAAGYMGPAILPSRGFRFLSLWGYAMTFFSLVGVGLALIYGYYLAVPAFMAVFVWGNHWNHEVPLAVQSMVSRPEYRGTLTGITNVSGYIPSFIGILFLPTLFDTLGLGAANLLIAAAPLAGLMATVLLFREAYLYSGDRMPASS